jgi:3-oxoacyl-[acyl-carrier-protein] synthase-3
MRSTRDCGTPWWEQGSSQFRIDFNPDKVASVIERGNALVPAIAREACARAGREVQEIDVLITNQPNPLFLEQWHTALGVAPERHVHTFGEYANLFGAAIPINLERGVRDGAIEPGDLVCLAGFAHAGDYSAAALVEWRG